MNSSNTAITPQQARAPKPIDNIRRLLEISKEQISLALPKHLTPERMMRVAITAVQKQPKLLECTPLSIVGAVVEASQLGLEPDGILGQAYLVPFYNGKTKRMEAQLQPGYRGLIALARRSGEVSSVSAELVYNSDKLKVTFGVHRDLIHEPDLDNPNREESGLRGAYASVLFKDGTTDFEYMALTELNRIRDMSKAKDRDGNEFGPWATHENEMYRKVPIRRLAKRLPLSAEFQRAAVLDEYVDAGVAPSMVDAIDNASETARIATEMKAEELKGKYLPPAAEESQERQFDASEENQDAEPPVENYDADPTSPAVETAAAQPEKARRGRSSSAAPTGKELFGNRE